MEIKAQPGFWQKYEIAAILAQYPALTLKVVGRRKVGMRRTDPLPVLVMAGGLYIIGAATHSLLAPFGIAVAVAGCWQNWNRWKEFRRGDPPWHTYSDGISPIEDHVVNRLARTYQSSLPPRMFSWQWWLHDRRIYRYLDPLAAYFIGLALLPLDRPLALWLMFAAASASVSEKLLWRHNVKWQLDRYDNMIDMLAVQGQQRGRQQSRPVRATYGLPTGIGNDIRAYIQVQADMAALRRAAASREERQRHYSPVNVSGPDNLVQR